MYEEEEEEEERPFQTMAVPDNGLSFSVHRLEWPKCVKRRDVRG
jgi:hypothetical protein